MSIFEGGFKLGWTLILSLSNGIIVNCTRAEEKYNLPHKSPLECKGHLGSHNLHMLLQPGQTCRHCPCQPCIPTGKQNIEIQTMKKKKKKDMKQLDLCIYVRGECIKMIRMPKLFCFRVQHMILLYFHPKGFAPVYL